MGPLEFNIFIGAILLALVGYALLGEFLVARALKRLHEDAYSIEDVRAARRAMSDARKAARQRGALNKALDILEAKRRREQRERERDEGSDWS